MAVLESREHAIKVINHVFLPPELPQKDEPSELLVLRVITSALTDFPTCMPSEDSIAIGNAITLLHNLQAIHSNPKGEVNEMNLHRVLVNLQPGQTMAINVAAQNAALLITRRQDQLIFEEFELSPENKAVYSTPGRLLRTFPASAVAVDVALVQNQQSDFAKEISNMLATMSSQAVSEMQPQTNKTGTNHPETRDSADPSIVSKLLFKILGRIGTPYSSSTISKNTREEVLWKDTLLPWRRSPMWLLIRVALQLVISRSSDGSHTLYKKGMLFIMSRILDSVQRFDLPADLLFVVNAKMDRRRQKLADAVTRQDPVMVYVANILRKSNDIISTLWIKLQADNTRTLNMEALKSLKFDDDTYVALPTLDSYIETINSRKSSADICNFKPPAGLLKQDPNEMAPLPQSASGVYALANLQRFEEWVAKHFGRWVVKRNANQACEQLCKAIKEYHSLASKLYARNPEGISVMLLTIMELWVVCDMAAVRGCNLLREYDPGIPLQALQNLLLPFRNQMQRLAKVEEHFDSRRQKGGLDCSLLFNATKSDSFASRFYAISEKHQLLLEKITSKASSRHQAKREEFERKKSEHSRFNALYNQASCEYTTTVVDEWSDETEEVHNDESCRKCYYADQCDSLRIDLFEWPLPEDQIQARVVAFELDVPSWFGHWRDARFYLLSNALEGSRKRSNLRAAYLLSSDDHLASDFKSNRHRISLLSEVKPATKTHFRNQPVSGLEKSTVCVQNGLKYQYYDSATNSYVGPFTFDDRIPLSCTYKLSDKSKALERFLFRPASMPDGKAPNQVIASQDACPPHLSLTEFKELSHLALGHYIQWSNIIAQLAMPSVDFKKDETTSFFLQCIYQAGPPSGDGVLRESHRVLLDDADAKLVMKNVRTALERVKRNWESSQALSTFVAIGSRVLSANSATKNACFAFLKDARRIAIGWMQALREKAFAATAHADRTEFTLKSIEVALICALTFNVDDEYLAEILHAPEDVSILVRACIIVQEGQHTKATRTPHVALLHLRFQRLLFRSYKILALNSAGLDIAIKQAWSSYIPGGSGWTSSGSTDHWMTTTTAASEAGSAKYVHYDLLTGELLVNGLPVAQPPNKYRSQPLFKTLFGQTVVEVMPASKSGFEFSTQRNFGGSQVQIGMNNGSLIVQTTNAGRTFETVPSTMLQGAYPHHFVNDYVLWYSASANIVELRPVDDPWNSESPLKWTLLQHKKSRQWSLTKNSIRLGGLKGKTAEVIGQILQPLAPRERIHCLLQPNNALLRIEIPTLQLGFSLHEKTSDLQSREYRHVSVDQNQNLGTLIGFSNKLMLKSQSGNRRLSMILEGDVTLVRQKGHVSAQVVQHSKSKVHTVEVDEALHRFKDSSGIDCKLYLAYLHAITSFCLPDPLTLRTGTEEALTILKSKAVESFDQLSQANVDLLAKIASLSPRRCYYPSHERVMQQVHWSSDLSVLSQHGHYSTIVSKLFEQATFAKIFFPDLTLSLPTLEGIEEDLRTRDNIRSSTFRVSGFGAEDHTTSYDKRYECRESSSIKTRTLAKSAQNVSIVTELILRTDETLHWSPMSTDDLWNLMRTASSIKAIHTPTAPTYMRYNANLLKEGFRDAVVRFPALHHWLKNQQGSTQHTFAIMIWLATLAFAEDADTSLLQILAMSYKSSELAKINPPAVRSFSPQEGRDFIQQQLRSSITDHQRRFEDCPEYNWARIKKERRDDYSIRRRKAWEQKSSAKINQVVGQLEAQWPCEVPTTPGVSEASSYIDMNGAMAVVSSKYKAWYNNALLYGYMSEIQQSLSRLHARTVTAPTLSMKLPVVRQSLDGFVSEMDLFANPAPSMLAKMPALQFSTDLVQASTGSRAPLRLRAFISSLSSVASPSLYERKYIEDLEASLQALVSKDKMDSSTVHSLENGLATHVKRCKNYIDRLYDDIVAAMCSSTKSQMANETQQLPRISPMFLLRQLAHDRWPRLPAEWQKCIIEYGSAWAALQRAERMSNLFGESDKDELIGELSNAVYAELKPHKHPEWLLIEVEGGITIREKQIEIAGEMQKPSLGSNAVMQLNMGEGKSSVIVPIVASALADGSQLVRVIVAKPQSKQMAQMMISKFGGLVNRRVYYLPFSRSLRLTQASAEAISKMLHECMDAGGILLVQPEHLLSFKLLALECFINERSDVGERVASTQEFLDRSSRDVVDEADENFSTRFELIYTIGLQTAVEMSPDRWLLIQQVLHLVKYYAPHIRDEFGSSIEITHGPAGSFPRMRLLRDDAENELLKKIASHIAEYGLEGFRLNRQTSNVREAVFTYITKRDLDPEEIGAVEEGQIWTDSTRSHLLMLRGLLALGVLGFTFGQKRYRVNYGLTVRSPATKLAVPYRAKDSPAPRSEFSHPDMVILLTHLSYYYQGLDDEDLFAAFGHLVNSDQAETEYQAWVQHSLTLPAAFKQLQGVNLKDRAQCMEELFPSLRHTKSVVDYFLSHLVLPKEMKEFPHKLSASGWDIGKTRDQLTTGFTGTVDSRPLLPVGMKYSNLPKQLHTNALVLEHLLQSENGIYLMPKTGSTSDAEHLLSSVMGLDPTPEVILDLGAQVLELSNLEMAKTWLALRDSSKEAVIFVNDKDEICVVDRNGRIALWQTSPYQSRPDACLVFLDESHTRGTDIKLPKYYRAAVTLGARVTKDRLVQACMRMRKLGKGQSVIFLISEEIQTKIRDATMKPHPASIEVGDVLVWSVLESHSEIRRSMPLWATQGERFVRQDKLWKATQTQSGQPLLSKDHARKFLEKEGQTIEDRYRPRRSPKHLNHLVDTADTELKQIHSRCQEFDSLQFDSSTLHEEQERELSPEIEQERQIQRAPRAKSVKHSLHPHVQQFAMDGEIVPGSEAYRPAFLTLQQLKAWKLLADNHLGDEEQLLATADFSSTVVEENASFTSDEFLRPVQWVLTRCARGSNQVDCVMIISPYEANQLGGKMTKTCATTLHLYKPRVNSSYASLDALDGLSVPIRTNVPCVPRSLAVQLNLFAGQLYISSYKDYEEICKVLGLLAKRVTEEMERKGWKVQADGFILCDDQGRIGGDSKLKKSPVAFIKALMSIRRNGDDISKTHMGALLEGKLFEASDFEA